MSSGLMVHLLQLYFTYRRVSYFNLELVRSAYNIIPKKRKKEFAGTSTHAAFGPAMASLQKHSLKSVFLLFVLICNHITFMSCDFYSWHRRSEISRSLDFNKCVIPWQQAVSCCKTQLLTFVVQQLRGTFREELFPSRLTNWTQNLEVGREREKSREQHI